VPGAFPPLKGDPVVLAADPAEHIRVILHGLHDKEIGSTKYAAPMPAFADQLKDEEVAAVASHERISWGNYAPTVTPADVARIRAEK
jgi:cytochrome c oxidase cbb3-type subunit 2